jgi:signal transduction histidine kinase
MGDAVAPGRLYRRHMVRRLMERWRAEDWRVELAIAVIVAVVSATGAWVGEPAASGRTGAFPATVALCAGLVLVARRVTPIVVLGVVLVLLVVASVDGHQLGTTPVALLFASHAAGRWAPGARGLVALVAIWVIFAGLALWGDPYFRSPIAVLAPVIYSLPFVVGRYIAARTERTEREWHEARDTERAQIARELHDIVTHALTGITVQAGTARHLRVEGEAATETFAQIETQGRQALGDLRRMLDLLRADLHGEGRPTPGLGDLRQLVDAHRSAHGPVTLTLDGGWQETGASVGLAIYRLVQEALTNVARHAHGAPASVVVACGARDVRVSVEDSGPGPAPGRPDSYGLVGMRERVELFGGTFDAGPRPEGGFAVHALIPSGR